MTRVGRRTQGCLKSAALAAVAGAMALLAAGAQSQEGPGFGDADSVARAEALWQALADARLVGDNAIRSIVYQSEPPHGAILEQLEATVAVGGPDDVETGIVIVKRNYTGSGLTRHRVMDSPIARYLASTSVMFRPDGEVDWFWASYRPDGTPDLANGLPMAGRIPFCIDCHQDAHGGDAVFRHDRYALE